MTVLAVAMGGVFASLMQSRRLTEGSVIQNSALTIVQGYIEQMKNMELKDVVGGVDSDGVPQLNTTSFAIPTRLDASVSDTLQTSSGSPPALSSFVAGTTPSGLVDNLRGYDVLKDSTDTNDDSADSGYAATGTMNWTAAWPGALNYPAAATVGRTHLKMNIWVWVSDLTGSSTYAQRVFGVTLIYTWQYQDGGRVKYHVGTVRTVRSTVPTF